MKGYQDEIFDSTRPRRPIIEDALELIRYRDLLWGLVQRDLTVRYKRSGLGFLWTMINPLLTMLVLTVVFSTFFRYTIEHYPVYLLSAFLLWSFFQQSTGQAMTNLVWGGDLINKIYVPKSVFVVSPVLVQLVNLVLALAPLALIMLVTGHPFSPALLFLPIPLLLTILFTLGVSLVLATLAVFFVDVIDIHRIALSILTYSIPMLYPIQIVPAKYLIFIYLNPLYYFVEIFREPIYLGILPDPALVMTAGLIALLTFLFGWWFFTRKADEFAYRI